jgi:curved DNA-binding protein CbpA
MSAIFDQSYYDVLEISQSATKEEIIRAYHRAKSAYSSNSAALYSVFSKEETEELLRLIDEAYTVLLSPESRKKYDISINPQSTLEIVENESRLPQEMPAIEVEQGRSATMNTPLEVVRTAPGSFTTASVVRAKSEFKVDLEFEKEIQKQESFDGIFLRRVREYKNITIDMIAEQTRIGKSYLLAIEDNDYKSLPATVFVRGFLVQYARILSLNEKQVADSYLKIAKDSKK